TAVLPQIERGEETSERSHFTQEVIHKLHKQPVVVIDKYPLDFLQVMDNQWLHILWVIGRVEAIFVDEVLQHVQIFFDAFERDAALERTEVAVVAPKQHGT